MPGLDQPLSDGGAHLAQADESDFHGSLSFAFHPAGESPLPRGFSRAASCPAVKTFFTDLNTILPCF
jgi:hypothetical protein